MTNEGERTWSALNIGSFHLIERDLVFYPLIFLYFLKMCFDNHTLQKKSKEARIIILLLAIFSSFAILGILNGYSIKSVGFHFRQVVYLLFFFPLANYFISKPNNFNKFIKFFIFITVSVSIASTLLYPLMIALYSSEGVFERNFLYWLEFSAKSDAFLRLMPAASNFYAPALGIILFDANNSKNIKGSIFMTGFIIIGSLVTMYRSIWISEIFTIFYIIYISRRSSLINHKNISYFLITIFGILTLILFTNFGNFIASKFMNVLSGDDISSNYRLLEYSVFLTRFLERPFMGHGFGYQIYYLDTLQSGDIMLASVAHNVFLSWLVTMGAIGTTLVIYILVKYLIMIHYSLNCCVGSPRRIVFSELLLLNWFILGLTTQNGSLSVGFFTIATALASTYSIKKF